jgi:hypothetical protein
VAGYKVVIFKGFGGFNVRMVAVLCDLGAKLTKTTEANFCYCLFPTNLAFPDFLESGTLLKLTLISRVIFLDTLVNAHRTEDSSPVLEPS